MKYAVLQRSYSAPVRVSDIVTAAARETTDDAARDWVAVSVRAAVLRGDFVGVVAARETTDDAARAVVDVVRAFGVARDVTVVPRLIIGVAARIGVVVVVDAARGVVFESREAASATTVPNNKIAVKIRTFLILSMMLAKFRIFGQVKIYPRPIFRQRLFPLFFLGNMRIIMT